MGSRIHDRATNNAPRPRPRSRVAKFSATFRVRRNGRNPEQSGSATANRFPAQFGRFGSDAGPLHGKVTFSGVASEYQRGNWCESEWNASVFFLHSLRAISIG